jgi:TolB-like protein
MASRELERIRRAVLEQRYALTEHAYDEMDADHLDVLDVEAAILTGRIDQRLTKDPRGTRYVITGKATDETTPVSVVVRFVEHDQLLVLTVYEKK